MQARKVRRRQCSALRLAHLPALLCGVKSTFREHRRPIHTLTTTSNIDILHQPHDTHVRVNLQVNKLRSKVDKLRLKQGRSASPKVAQNLEEAMRRLQVREGQLAGELTAWHVWWSWRDWRLTVRAGGGGRVHGGVLRGWVWRVLLEPGVQQAGMRTQHRCSIPYHPPVLAYDRLLTLLRRSAGPPVAHPSCSGGQEA